jgi:hypothetical protein
MERLERQFRDNSQVREHGELLETSLHDGGKNPADTERMTIDQGHEDMAQLGHHNEPIYEPGNEGPSWDSEYNLERSDVQPGEDSFASPLPSSTRQDKADSFDYSHSDRLQDGDVIQPNDTAYDSAAQDEDTSHASAMGFEMLFVAEGARYQADTPL